MRDWLFSQWCEKITLILESMADVHPSFEPRPPAPDASTPSTPAPGSFIWRQSFAILPDPCFWVATDFPTCIDLGSRTLQAAGIESHEDADAQNTFLEILVQSLSALAHSIGSHLDTSVAPTDGEQLEELPDRLEWTCFQLECGGVLEPFWLACSKSLLETLQSGPISAVKQPGPKSTSPETAGSLASANAGSHAGASAGVPIGSQPDPSTIGSKTFEVMLDVSLPVSISFGRTFLPIKDVLKLNTGSIVELDRGVSEPVEIIVNNCVIARGEVVVIEGNYGVRIQQIASRYDRLRTGTSATQAQHAIGGKPQ